MTKKDKAGMADGVKAVPDILRREFNMKRKINLLTFVLLSCVILCVLPGRRVSASPCSSHNRDDVRVTEPTCTQAGKKEYYCTNCGELVASEVLPALGHDCWEGYWRTSKKQTASMRAKRWLTASDALRRSEGQYLKQTIIIRTL